MTTQTMTRQDAATIIADQFTTGTRADGSTYVTCPDDSDAKQLVRKIYFDVFDGMFPSDWVHEKTRDIVLLYAEDDNNLETAYELADTEYAELFAWLDNLIFVDESDEAMIDRPLPPVKRMRSTSLIVSQWLEAYADTRS